MNKEKKKAVLLQIPSQLEEQIEEYRERRYPYLTMTAFFLHLAKEAIEEDKRK